MRCGMDEKQSRVKSVIVVKDIRERLANQEPITCLSYSPQVFKKVVDFSNGLAVGAPRESLFQSSTSCFQVNIR